MNYMPRFLSNQLKKFEKLDNFLAVGKPNFVSDSVWDQYLHSHPDSIHMLELACQKYDEIFGLNRGTSMRRLKELKYYYPRSIFLTDTKFMQNWLNNSFAIAQELDKKVNEFPENRWGGFVLERLFTLFVMDFTYRNKVKLYEFQQVYFFEFEHWAKASLLQWRLIRTIHKFVPRITKRS
jgi:hypothetical protein